MTTFDVSVGGAGILGLWQALLLARSGHRVTLYDPNTTPFSDNASSYAGAMLAPDCEAEAAPPIVRDLGRIGLAQWRSVYPALVEQGTLVVAAARDRPDLERFAKRTQGHRLLTATDVAALEPALGPRFASGLFFPDEAHMGATDALVFLLEAVRAAGAIVRLGTEMPERAARGAVLVDCRGMGARPLLPGLRGVRGERVIVRTRDVSLLRPVRLLHPRHPLYVVPWRDGRFMIGATVIESEDPGPSSVRSALELLGAAYALHPGFGEAEILEIGAGVRPAFADNVPRVIVRDCGRRILVNGAYRHGYLLAPVLATAVLAVLEGRGGEHPLVMAEAAPARP